MTHSLVVCVCSSFLGYSYTTDPGEITLRCVAVNLLCNASVPVQSLSQRSWFIDDVKDYHGNNYFEESDVRVGNLTLIARS